tara:strand:+ start:1123 stop:1350 length:228 start_codon:yes stop_codon:yes gene_type:complete
VTDSKPKREFSTFVRMPYQDAIALLLKTMDYHSIMAIQSTDKNYKQFHEKQHRRLKDWMLDMKDYIIELEEELNV